MCAVVYRSIPTSNRNSWSAKTSRSLLYIVLFLHQTATYYSRYAKGISCISFYKRVLFFRFVVYRSIPTSNRNGALANKPLGRVVYRSIPTSNRNRSSLSILTYSLYIVLFLHQTATTQHVDNQTISCISFYSYIKPQRAARSYITLHVVYRSIPTSNRNSPSTLHNHAAVVYRSIPTSNRNMMQFIRVVLSCISFYSYIKPQLVETHTLAEVGCISFYSYIKPQRSQESTIRGGSCISFYSYIKPQRTTASFSQEESCISFYSYIKPQPYTKRHFHRHGCISFYSYIKPQRALFCKPYGYVVYRSIPTSNRNYKIVTPAGT